MNRIYDSVEPRVMDNDMLKLAVGEQGPQEEAGQLAKQEGILFKDVLSLQLDFQNILRIDNLWQFENLKKLQLDNNIIERIEGLENLTQLVWLDLSFNNITVIEGLDTLVNLEDLSLFNNRISKIDSLDALVKLQVLSLGNNQIDDMMNKELAELKYQYSIDELKHREHLREVQLEEEQAQRAKLEEYKMAFVEHLNSSFLFDSMYAEDVEGSKLSCLPTVGELLKAYPSCLPGFGPSQVGPESLHSFLGGQSPEDVISICDGDSGHDDPTTGLNCKLRIRPLTYKEKFVIICLNIFEYGLKQQEKRKLELDTFNECVQEAIKENQEQGKLRIAKFEEKHLLNLSAIREEPELLIIEKKIVECSEDISELFNVLMTLEMQLVEQLECRDLENHHHEKLLEISISTLEKILKGEPDEELPDDVRALFVDKDTIVNAVGASHDIHLLKIDNREDELVTRINSWCTHLVDKIHKDEVMRNRKRVKEINQYIDHMQSELDNLECGDVD
ncbi:Leucine-rich repeat-containing protein 48 [Fukomys damarensis]|uniref:Dynein regulatory complex subunit 3 n=1 Tax=Fukomys damarensis TaxID=885580 RepID=A0A091DXZ2_FUKDA|nr:Leucine-rich repeat-containing protein 48 [Fukomys damarensis]